MDEDGGDSTVSVEIEGMTGTEIESAKSYQIVV
jgi:hypothetical protein